MLPENSFPQLIYDRITAILARPLLNQTSNPILALGLVVGVIALTAVLAFSGSQDTLVAVLVLIAGSIVTLAQLRWQAMGFLFILVAGMVLPSVGNSKVNASMLVVAWLLLLWLLNGFTRRHNFQILASKIVRPLLALLVVSVISFGVGQLPWFSFVENAPLKTQVAGLAIVVLAVVTFLLAADTIQEIRWLKIITWAFVFIGSIYIIGRVVPGLDKISQKVLQGRISGGIFSAWFPTITFSQAVFNRDLKLRWRLILGFLCLATLYNGVVLRFDWKSFWLPGVAGVFAIILAREWRVGLWLVLPALIFAWVMRDEIQATDEYSISTRLEGWLIISQIVKENPILGVGFANYYYYTALFPIRGWYVVFNSHNNYVDLIAQTGLLGFFFFCLFFWGLGRLGWTLREKMPDGFSRAYVYGAIGGLVGMLTAGMLGDWLFPFVYNLGLNTLPIALVGWVLLGGLLAVARMASLETQQAGARQ